ncbi:acyltransferase family protein [Aquiflexum gelatinilyticum]|uniref:Acyltransferase family protein n=1 Tax=Aquiflexum gelatinilyticum TaxID=2961943 RepID=A0A9X2P6H0_9BACT|nr:acyltransferase family protein [Aquiflexum gelatinilyticum]MCR9015706.1 acyltransferase family protein [Aquiflexum gelatinilyticum]
METTTSLRRYDLDWLRFFAIILLLFYHTGMLFSSWGWHVKNEETSLLFNYWMIWSHDWRMPLLLFISGAGTFMALGKRSKAQFVRERFTKLFVPLAFGMFVIVPPQIYFERIAEFSSFWEFYPTTFDFDPYPKGNFSWHHLWFIAYLLIYSILILPLLAFLRKPVSQGFKTFMEQIFTKPVAALMIPAVIILLSQLVLRPYFPNETHDFQDWAYFVFYFLFFAFGLIFYSNPKLWDSLGRNRKIFLSAAVLILIPFYGSFLHFRGAWSLPMNPDDVESFFDVTSIFLSWFTVLTIISYGQFYLNRPHPILKYINEGLYPFYILHQTVIIVIGYYICKWDLSIWAKYWIISFGTLEICLGIYFGLIRPFNGVRFLFGMKPVDAEKSEDLKNHSFKTT